jgi:hypothetical protein
MAKNCVCLPIYQREGKGKRGKGKERKGGKGKEEKL